MRLKSGDGPEKPDRCDRSGYSSTSWSQREAVLTGGYVTSSHTTLERSVWSGLWWKKWILDYCFCLHLIAEKSRRSWTCSCQEQQQSNSWWKLTVPKLVSVTTSRTPTGRRTLGWLDEYRDHDMKPFIPNFRLDWNVCAGLYDSSKRWLLLWQLHHQRDSVWLTLAKTTKHTAVKLNQHRVTFTGQEWLHSLTHKGLNYKLVTILCSLLGFKCQLHVLINM